MICESTRNNQANHNKRDKLNVLPDTNVLSQSVCQGL